MQLITAKIENVTLPSQTLTKIWLGFIALGWPCTATDTGGGRHSITVQMPVGQSTNPQATALFRQLGGA